MTNSSPERIAPELEALAVPVGSLRPFPGNARRGDVAAIAASLAELGQFRPIIVNRGTATGRPDEVLAGNHTLAAARRLGWDRLAATYVDVDAATATKIVLADNRTAELGSYDDTALVELLRSVPDFDATGWTHDDFEALVAKLADDRADALRAAGDTGPSLFDRFLLPPFTVLDARSGPWQERKRRWFAAGLRSDLGRDEGLFLESPTAKDPQYYTKKRAAEQALGRGLSHVEFQRTYYVPPDPRAHSWASGTSIFDPVLCEIAYRWFSPPGGHVVDPWAGGSTRGLVAARLGRSYTGIELRAEQVEANRAQVEPFLGAGWTGPVPEWIVGDAGLRLPDVAGTADMILGCPPYFDLESYSDDPNDLSNLSEAGFVEAYGEHLAGAYRALKPDRFAFMFLVVGSVRDKKGRLRDLRSMTVTLAEKAGFALHNDGVLLTQVGSASVRTARAFKASRALGRVHQDLLIFVKGDRRAATAAAGDAEVDDALLDVLYDVSSAEVDPDVDVPPVGLPPATLTRPDPTVTDSTALTPVELVVLGNGGTAMVKRDDAFLYAGSRGGKVRACLGIVGSVATPDPERRGLVTAGSRQSPQVNIVAGIAAHFGWPCRVHVPAAKGPLTPELAAAVAAGAELVEHRPGYNSVIVARAAAADAAERGWLEVPFGMEHGANLDATAAQVVNLEAGSRIVVPVGSGMALAGILRGLDAAGDDRPILGVRVGADPSRRLDLWAPGWRDRPSLELVTSPLDYHAHAPVTVLDGIALDPVYEAKCLPFLRAGDTLWIVGRRATAAPDAEV